MANNSYNKGNLGGSGKPSSRMQYYQKKDIKRLTKNEAFKSEDEVKHYLNGNKVMCLECGEEFAMLGRHLSSAHLMSSQEYKKKYNIPSKYSLVGVACRTKKSEIQKQNFKDGKLDKGFAAIMSKEVRDKKNEPRNRLDAKSLFRTKVSLICKWCQCSFEKFYNERHRQFCCVSCSAKYRNENETESVKERKRKATSETHKRLSKTRNRDSKGLFVKGDVKND